MKAPRPLAVIACGLAAAGLGALGYALTPSPRPAATIAQSPSGQAFIAQRCQLLAHDRHRLDIEAQRLADEELAAIFLRMDARVDAFAEWAFRWRTSYALLRRSAVGALSAAAHGNSVPARLAVERDAFVEEAFRSTIVLDEDAELLAAALRWRDRLRNAADEMDREHDTAVTLYLGFRPQLGLVHSGDGLPPAPGSPGATEEAKSFATSRVARPLLVRASARLTAAMVPTTFISDALVETTLLPVTVVSVGALLGIDFLISRVDAWTSREIFAAEIRTALDDARKRLSDTWTETGRAEIGRRIDQRRAVLSAMAGPQGCR